MKNPIGRNMFVVCVGGGVLALALAGAPAFTDTGTNQGTPVAGKSATMHGAGTVTAIDKSTRT